MTDAPSTSSIPLTNDSTPTTPDHSGRNRLVINLMLVATFVVFLNETIVGVAVPRVMEDLRIEASTAQ